MASPADVQAEISSDCARLSLSRVGVSHHFTRWLDDLVPLPRLQGHRKHRRATSSNRDSYRFQTARSRTESQGKLLESRQQGAEPAGSKTNGKRTQINRYLSFSLIVTPRYWTAFHKTNFTMTHFLWSKYKINDARTLWSSYINMINVKIRIPTQY